MASRTKYRPHPYAVSQNKIPGTYYITTYSEWDRGNTVVAVNFRSRQSAEKYADSRNIRNYKIWKIPGDWRYI